MSAFLMFFIIEMPVYADDDYTILPEDESEIVVEKVTLTYDTNGGEAGPVAETVDKNTKVIVSDVIPTRNGYSFKGWTMQNLTYKAGDSLQLVDSTTLYAKWSANKYNIAFNGNGSTSGKMSTLKNLSFDKIYTLAKNAYKKKGYKFVGWNTKADGTGESYSNSEKVQGMYGKNKGTITLYAQWEINTYKITYNLNGGTNNESNPESYTIKTSTIKLASPKKTGYSFKGWYSDSKFKTKVTEIKK